MGGRDFAVLLVDRLLYLVAILYPQANISQMRANLFGDDLRRRANAIELLDTLLSSPHKGLMLPLLESSPKRMLEVAGRAYHLDTPELQSEFSAAVEANDFWLAACILFSLSSRRQMELSSLIDQGLRSPNALVRETARLTASRQFDPAGYQMAQPGSAGPDHNINLCQQALSQTAGYFAKDERRFF